MNWLPFLILGIGLYYALQLFCASCVRGHWWSPRADACWRCEKTGTEIAKTDWTIQ